MKELEKNLDKVIAYLEDQLLDIQAGAAKPMLLDKVMVDYEGTYVPLQSIAKVVTPDARTLMVTPFAPEKKVLQEIEKGIMHANLGFNPQNDGQNIRIAIPLMTEEKRKELAKKAKAEGDEAKIGVKKQREAALSQAKKAQKDKTITEDELKKIEKDIRKTIENYNKKIDILIEKKAQELTKI